MIKARLFQARRQFLQAGLATAGGLALGACGGGSVEAAAVGTVSGEVPTDTNGPTGTNGGSGAPPTAGTYVVQATTAKPEVFPPGTTTRIASGASGMSVQVSPDLPPGRSLALSAEGEVSVVSAADSPVVTIDRPWVIEVMDSPIATIRNVTQNITYEYAPTGSWPAHDNQARNRWNWVIGQAHAGDIIEISPGAAQAVEADSSNYHSNSVDSCGLAVLKPLTIRNMSGRGRWRVYPADATFADNRNGIGVFLRAEMYDHTRTDIVLEGFDLTDQFLTNAVGVRMRSPYPVEGSWADDHASITLRNFKIGRTSGRSLSGVSGGGTEVLTLEDGHIFDCGNGSGQEHNVYASAGTMTFRGVRFSRTRGWSSLPAWSGNETLEGHILKVSAITGTVEGCVIDCATLGDQSELLQMKAGGNWTLRGNLIIDSKYPNNANGAIMMTREQGGPGGAEARGATTNGAAYSAGATTITIAAAGTGRLLRYSTITFAGDATQYVVASSTISDVSLGGSITVSPALTQPISASPKSITVVSIPNYEWWAGSDGNSLLFERNVYIGHYPRPILWFLTTAGYPGQALYPSGDTSVAAERRLSALTVRDNIAMVMSTAETWMLRGFPGMNNSLWINNDPNAGTNWGARGNSIEIYDANEAPFANRALKVYTRAAGPIAAAGGTLSTRRFQYPHGSVTRMDSLRGLG
jgi:hypothetical protein